MAEAFEGHVHQGRLGLGKIFPGNHQHRYNRQGHIKHQAQQAADQVGDPDGRSGFFSRKPDEHINAGSHEGPDAQSCGTQQPHGALETHRDELAFKYFLDALGH